MSDADSRALPRLAGALLTLGAVGVFVGLAVALFRLPPGNGGLCEAVDTQLYCAGVSNPVTAVLINFRGYDTLLEIAVLLLALIATWAIARGELPATRGAGDVLAVLAGVQAPAMILIAGYLLWSGADAPGGAFQAGAILASAGVLLVLADRHGTGRLQGLPRRGVLALGLLVFLGTGVAGLLAGDGFLVYPVPAAGKIILVLEVTAAASIGLILFDVFASILRTGQPRDAPPPDSDAP